MSSWLISRAPRLRLEFLSMCIYGLFAWYPCFSRPDASLEPAALGHTSSLNKPCFCASPSVAGWSDLLSKLTFQPSTTTTITTLGSSIHLTPALGIVSAFICKPGCKRKGTPDSTVAVNRSSMSLMAACNNNRCSHNFTL